MENEEMSKVTEGNAKFESMEYKEAGKAAETNGKKVETYEVVGGKQYEVIEGKVDWRGRPAVRGRHGGVGNSFFILVNFGLENLASLSLAVNLIMYFMLVMHINLADASNLLTNYMGTSYMIAVLITVFADTFVGRYQTVIISSVVELIGLLLMTLQAHSPKLLPKGCKWPEPTCERVRGHSELRLYVGLYLVAIGSAGIKAALPAHCADQFDAKHPRERRQMSSFFNWLLLSLCIGGAFSVTVFVWIQNVKGWDRGFGAATGVMGLALIAFLVGMPRYRIFTVQGSSALLEIFRCGVRVPQGQAIQITFIFISFCWCVWCLHANATMFTEQVYMLRFLDRAAIVQASTAETPSPWRQCRVTHVEHAKTVLAMVPIFCSAIIMGTCLAHFQMQPATLPIIPLGMLILVMPIYEHLFVPFARGVTGHPNGIPYLQRVGVGLVLSIVSMCIAVVVEMYRKKVAVWNGILDAIPMVRPLPMSAPPALKSMSSAFLWASMSLGYYFSTIIVKAVNAATKKHTLSGGWLNGNNINRNHLDLFFWLLAVLSFINFLNYLYWASWYKYVKPQDEEENVDEQQV
ncbi:hypothetical protein ZWY2020_004985 [Hordeum vulgare]|nr:hypothetical protein ZWY2020_004985 [Hordeum vulgare]